MWYTMYVIYVIVILALYSNNPHVYYYITYKGFCTFSTEIIMCTTQQLSSVCVSIVGQ